MLMNFAIFYKLIVRHGKFFLFSITSVISVQLHIEKGPHIYTCGP